MAAAVHIPWYATLFRGDKLEIALREIAPVSLRYGATDYAVYRARDDRYKFLQIASFPDKLSFEAYWYGDEFIGWRADYSSWFQVPVVYAWHDLTIGGRLGGEVDQEAAPTSAGESGGGI